MFYDRIIEIASLYFNSVASMGDRTAFFYGTLMAPGVLYRVIYGNAKPEAWQQKLTTVRPALLESYRRHRVKDMSYPAIIPHTDSSVRGFVVTGLTGGDIYRLDVFEGSQYDRKKVNVKVLMNLNLDEKMRNAETRYEAVEEVEAETYIWRDDINELEEKEWDFEEFRRDKMKFWMGEGGNDDNEIEVDEGFADVDNAVAARKVKDETGGRGMNGAITKELEGVRQVVM